MKKPAPWLILGATALGNGGVFCWYSYITPLLTEVSGFSADSITALMVLAGFGMVVGNLVSGRMSDRYTPGKVGTVVQGMICVILLLIFLLSPHPWCSAILMTLCTAGLFAVSSPEQVLMIRVAPGGEMLGGACVQMAFNLGECYRSLYRRSCLEWRIPLSRIGRRTVCTDGIYFIPCLLQEISGEVLSVSFFLCMFVRKY